MPVTIDGSNTPTAGGVVYGDGTEYASTAAGTSGQLLQSNGASAPSWVAAPTTSPAGSTGQVQYNNAGAFGAISSGTSGQVLTSAGSGAAPTWTTPSSGALVFISSATASNSASVTFTGLSSTYAVYLVEIVSAVPASSAYLYMRSSSDNGSSYDTTGYEYSSFGVQTNSGTTTVDSSYGTSSFISVTNNAGSINSTASISGYSGFVYIMDPASSNYTKFMIDETHMTPGNFGVRGHGIGLRSSTSPVNAIQFLMSSGNIASGTFRLYGIANS